MRHNQAVLIIVHAGPQLSAQLSAYTYTPLSRCVGTKRCHTPPGNRARLDGHWRSSKVIRAIPCKGSAMMSTIVDPCLGHATTCLMNVHQE